MFLSLLIYPGGLDLVCIALPFIVLFVWSSIFFVRPGVRITSKLSYFYPYERNYPYPLVSCYCWRNALCGSDRGPIGLLLCLIYFGILNYITFMHIKDSTKVQPPRFTGSVKIDLAMQGFGVVQRHCNLSFSVKNRRSESCPRIPLPFSNLTSKTRSRLGCAIRSNPPV